MDEDGRLQPQTLVGQRITKVYIDRLGYLHIRTDRGEEIRAEQECLFDGAWNIVDCKNVKEAEQ